MKKNGSLLLTLTVVLSLLVLPTSATSDKALVAANELHDLGLFSGVGTNADGSINYDLDRTMTRAEAVTMLVRLLGKEEEAKSRLWETPFTDVSEWAKPYVGYAYANNLTNGIGSDSNGGQLFGGNRSVSATQYLTFILRTLGYDSNSDFQWDRAWELTDKLEITQGNYNKDTLFERADAVIISLSAVNTRLKDCDFTLLDSLKGNKKQDVFESFSLEDEPILLPHLLHKVGDEYCGSVDDNGKLIGTRTFFYSAADNLIFPSFDIMRNESGDCCSWEIIGMLRFALMTDYKMNETKNPYIKEIVISKPGLFDRTVFRCGTEETIWYSASKSYTPTWLEVNGVKVYNLNSTGEKYQVQDGIRYYNGKPCINDIFKKFGIEKEISIGRYQDYYYVEIK